jgi:hypothetical protein
MKKKVSLVLSLAFLAAGFAGCTAFPPTAESPGMILRAWWRDLSDIQKDIDRHFLNYDYDDPFNE